jgi:hypothetical protein
MCSAMYIVVFSGLHFFMILYVPQFKIYSICMVIYFLSRYSTAERSETSNVFGRSNVEIAGSNPARGMDVCLRFSVLCCPVCR